MFLTAENILLVGSILIFSSILISKTGYRFGIPTLLLFLVVGMAFGCYGQLKLRTSDKLLLISETRK